MLSGWIRIQKVQGFMIALGGFILLTSSTGIGAEYIDYPNNPVFSGQQAWNNETVTSPVVRYDDNGYSMWFMGRVSGFPLSAGFAFSDDGVEWEDTFPPILTTGDPGEWDDHELQKMEVIFDGTEYKLWYTGGRETGMNHIGLATSLDGIAWTKHESNPVISPGESGTWNSNRVKGPAVIFVDGIYMMWLEGLTSELRASVGLYTSTDGIEWTQYPYNPVFERNPDIPWESVGMNIPDVIMREDGTFLMMYGGYDGSSRSCGFAFSDDGIVWQRYSNNPVVTSGGPGTWNENYIIGPNGLIRDLGHYQIWYTGDNGSSHYQTGFGDFFFEAMGDINYDYSHDISDVIRLVNYILGYTEFNPYQIVVGDIANDGSINVGDVVALVEYILN